MVLEDEILAYTINRGGGFVVLAIAGYLAAALTAFYAFRMVFRVFTGKKVPEAGEGEAGHLHHGEPQGDDRRGSRTRRQPRAPNTSWRSARGR